MSLTIARNNSATQGVRKRAIAQVLHVGPLSLRFITLIIFAAIALFYLAQSTQSATNVYDIQALSRDREKLENELSELKVQELRFKALNELKNSTEQQGLVPISQ